MVPLVGGSADGRLCLCSPDSLADSLDTSTRAASPEGGGSEGGGERSQPRVQVSVRGASERPRRTSAGLTTAASVRRTPELSTPALVKRPPSPPGCTADASFSRCVGPGVCVCSRLGLPPFVCEPNGRRAEADGAFSLNVSGRSHGDGNGLVCSALHANRGENGFEVEEEEVGTAARPVAG